MSYDLIKHCTKDLPQEISEIATIAAVFRLDRNGELCSDHPVANILNNDIGGFSNGGSSFPDGIEIILKTHLIKGVLWA